MREWASQWYLAFIYKLGDTPAAWLTCNLLCGELNLRIRYLLPLASDYYQYTSIFPIHQSTNTNPVSVCGNANLPYLLLVNFNNSFEDLPLKNVNYFNIVLIYYNVLYLKVYMCELRYCIEFWTQRLVYNRLLLLNYKVNSKNHWKLFVLIAMSGQNSWKQIKPIKCLENVFSINTIIPTNFSFEICCGFICYVGPNCLSN